MDHEPYIPDRSGYKASPVYFAKLWETNMGTGINMGTGPEEQMLLKINKVYGLHSMTHERQIAY